MTSQHDDERVRELLRDAGDTRFDSGFSSRVMGRLARERAQPDDISVALARQSRRVIPALLAASLALVAYNWQTTRDVATSPLDAVLGVTRVATVAASTPLSLEGVEAFQ